MKWTQPIVALALLLAAVPTPASGQTGVAEPLGTAVFCPEDKCHFGPFFRGQGGLVGRRAAAHVDEDGEPLPVTLIVTCGPRTVVWNLEPAADGVIRQALTNENGLGCPREAGGIQVEGLADGGWYWINDDRNSAVATLLPAGVKRAERVEPLDPGGLTLTVTEDGLGTYIEDEETGRVGILPHHLPAAGVLPPCPGANVEGSRCRVGGPGDWRLVLTTGADGVPVGSYDVIERGDGVRIFAGLVHGGYLHTGPIRAAERLSSGRRDDYLQAPPLGLEVLHNVFLDHVEGAVWVWQINVPLSVNGSALARCAPGAEDRFRSEYVLIEAGGLEGASPAFTFENGPSASFWVRCPSSSSASAAEGAAEGGLLPVE